MPNSVRLPIKIVVPRDEDIRRPERAGGGTKEFGDVSNEVREALDAQVHEVHQYFQASFRASPNLPCVARVILKPDALAKSHRPVELLDKASCPVIGTGGLGELFISASPSGLRDLSNQIRYLSTRVGKANISTIQKIAPFTADNALGRSGKSKLMDRIRSGTSHLKFRLFRHHKDELDQTIYQAFLDQLKLLGLRIPDSIHYGSGLRIFKVSEVHEEMVEPLASFVGTQALSTFPTYSIHRSASRALGPLPADSFPPPSSEYEYPIVGIIDSGIEPTNLHLAPWIVGREEYVAVGDRNHDHGTFVAGLAVHAQRLNHHPRFSDASSRLLDILALPASGNMSEDELLAILEDVLPKHREVRVWNLSLSRDEPCDGQSFSDLAIALDELQDRYGVTFVIAAGNYNASPFRGWPPDDLGEGDRVSPPADSIRALSVGSMAHLDRPGTRVRRGQPSPFSRRGPGPVFVPKPELVHYGGNCDANGGFTQTGVISTKSQGQLAEDIGTSFAAPMVASLLANVESALLGPASRNLMKALLVHSAVFDSKKIGAEELRYRGFGVPGDLVSVLTCSSWAATLVFETELLPGLEFERWPFPIPACLRNPQGLVSGEILMTAVYQPPLDSSFGSEYCRSNVDVSLGTYDRRSDGEREHRKQIPPEPRDLSQLFESHLVEHGFKWSPIKVYRRHMKRGIRGRDWRLKVTVNHRSGFASTNPQEFALIVTIRDPNREKPVYDEVVSQMQSMGWITTDLQVSERVRMRR